MDRNNKQTHPSYGMLGLYRTTCNKEQSLFGSSIRHRDTINMRLKRGSCERDLNNDWYYGDELLFDVEMSYTQFAELITSMNCGDGVPVTIREIVGEGKIPPCPFESKVEQFQSEYRSHLDAMSKNSSNLIQEVQNLFSSKKALTKKEKEEIVNKLHHLDMDINSNDHYRYKMFNKQMEKTTTEAKGEIEAFYQNKIMSLTQRLFTENQETILGSEPVIELDGVDNSTIEDI